ncbi:MAG: ABC transporter substrate binding protein [Spirochaetaceae bacterium]|jgi:ABC-type uncharacterized transport system substrate-binding protein|nr:ABC transporter substrate binding protein [Spirochaetaceae bacterium]
MSRVQFFVIALLFFLLYVSLGCRKKNVVTPWATVTTEEHDIKKKVLYIDSYHAEYPWVEGIMNGMLSEFNITWDNFGNLDNSSSDIDLLIIHMDTKRNLSEEFILEAAEYAKIIIEEWQPDVVITSDDNASKYVIVPYFMDSSIPFVFCGVNWDASVYGFPNDHITGMVEVLLIQQLVDQLSQYSEGSRVGFLKGDTQNARNEGVHFERVLGYEINQQYVDNYADWKDTYIEMQSQVDILLVGNWDAIPDFTKDNQEIQKFIEEHTTIPTGAWDPWLSEAVLLTFATQAEEQGEWIAQRAMEILQGKDPGDIPVTENKRASVYLNMTLAKDLGIQFPIDLILRSHMVLPIE